MDVKFLGATASSQLDNTHTPSYSRLYGVASWCSASVSLQQYLQFNAGKVITVSGIAIQGDNVENKWVTSYAISYGYDGQKWLDYSGGMLVTGNTNRSSIVVNWLSTPFAAQYIRIWPKTFNGGICMRADLLGCEDFQVPFIFVDKLEDAVLRPSPPGSATLHCVATFSKQRPPTYQWRRGVTDLPESSSSLMIRYTDINSNYQCSRTSSSVRDFQCYATYQCSTSLVDLPQIKDDKNANVTATIKISGKPIVYSANIRARSTQITWTYNRGSDEAPTDSFILRLQNNDIRLSSSQSSKQLNNLKPYTSYTVRVKATSFLGTGNWSDPETFTTLTAVPEVTVQVLNVRGITSRIIYVEWTQPSFETLNGPFDGYTVAYREVGSPKEQTLDVQGQSTTFTIIPNLKIWTRYLVRVSVDNRDFHGPLSPEKETRTLQDDQQENTGTSKEPSSPGCNTILLVVPNIVLAILLCLSVGWNVYLCRRARRTSKAGEKYLPNEAKTETTQNDRAIANVQPPREPSNYMELQPTPKSHVTEQQYMNTMSQYQPLTRRRGKDSKPSVAYENASFHTRLGKKDHGAGLYEEVNA